MTKSTHCLLSLALAQLTGCSNDTGFSGRSRVPQKSDTRTAAVDVSPDELEDTGTSASAIPTVPPPVAPTSAKDDEKAQVVDREFEVASTLDGVLEVDFTRSVFEQTVTLTNAYDKVDKELTQIDRPAYSKQYYQGNAGANKTDTFQQNAMGILDLVVVIDNSGSMAEEQSNLSTKLEPLLQYVTSSNWAINVVTTDPANGCTRGGLIPKGAANATAAFQAAVTAGTGGSSNERGFLQAVNALSCPQVMGFPRANSSIAVLIVADEDNCSANGADCGTADWSTPAYLTSFMQTKLGRTLGKDARVYGIFWHPDTLAADCATGRNQATQYAKAVVDTKGVYGTICAPDYSATLRKISQDMATLLKSQFTLSGDPDAGSLVVKINGVVQTTGYSLVGRILTFDPAPAFSATIEASYTVGTSVIKTRFALDEVPAPGTLEVLVDGVIADKNGYSIDAATKELVFAAPPAEYAKIDISFRRDMPLLTDFPLDAAIRDGTLTLKVNGAPATDYTVSAEGLVQFKTPPPDAAAVSASFEVFKEHVLDYPVSLTGTAISSLSVLDADTGDLVAASYQDGVLSIDEVEHVEGRRLRIRYENETSSLAEIELPELPEADSVSIEGAPAGCEDSFVVEGTKVTYTCAEPSDVALELYFQYRGPSAVEFALEEVKTPETGTWMVFVDGVETKAYEREDNVITLHDDPPAAAIVRIVWTTGP